MGKGGARGGMNGGEEVGSHMCTYITLLSAGQQAKWSTHSGPSWTERWPWVAGVEYGLVHRAHFRVMLISVVLYRQETSEGGGEKLRDRLEFACVCARCMRVCVHIGESLTHTDECPERPGTPRKGGVCTKTLQRTCACVDNNQPLTG